MFQTVVVYMVCPVFVLRVNMCCYAFIGFLQQCHQDKCDGGKKKKKKYLNRLTPALWIPVTLWTTWWEPNAKRWRCIKMGHWARRCWSATTAAVATSSSWASSQPRPIPWWCFSAGQCWRGGGLVHRQTNPHKSSMFCSVRVFWGTAWDLYMFADYKLLWSIIER